MNLLICLNKNLRISLIFVSPIFQNRIESWKFINFQTTTESSVLLRFWNAQKILKFRLPSFTQCGPFVFTVCLIFDYRTSVTHNFEILLCTTPIKYAFGAMIYQKEIIRWVVSFDFDSVFVFVRMWISSSVVTNVSSPPNTEFYSLEREC